jgi:Peptidase family M1 domain
VRTGSSPTRVAAEPAAVSSLPVSGRAWHWAAGAVTVAAVLAACTATREGRGRSIEPSSAASSSSTPSSSVSGSEPPSCPASYLPPRSDRPQVKLAFAVAPDLTTVRGTEQITFIPDRPITELVFRLTANTAPTAATGARIVVTSASADHNAGAATYSSAGADPTTQGGLLHIPFPRALPAGTEAHADLAFTLTLGDGAFDRIGRVNRAGGRFAWFASAHPLLAWENGYGWHTEPMLQFAAESATSEAMRTDLTVTAPAADTVLASGNPTNGDPDGDRRVWHATLDAARDVSVAVGPFQVSDTRVGSVALRVGAADTATRDALVPDFRQAIIELTRRFGPFPFPSLSVARVPEDGGGIEYPGAIQMLSSADLVAVHETAHQWFYAMVGDSQAEHAWLDEAFATYAEQLVDNTPPAPGDLTLPGPVDRPTADYGADAADYYRLTYGKGAAALRAARAAAGPVAFDAAIRCYVNANAWRIAEPSDVATALRDLPAAIAVLRTAGALR